DKLGVEEQERRAQTNPLAYVYKSSLATHAYACPPRICVLFNNPTPLLHSSLTHPRTYEAFYAYAYPLFHHPAQPSFYTKATLPTHMRALHAYACYHNTQHHHTPSCPTIFTLRPPFHAYASRSTHMHDIPLPTSPHSKLPTHYPRICVHSYAYAWDTYQLTLPFTSLSLITQRLPHFTHPQSFQPTTHAYAP
ncbi:hypothetical protein PIB30_102377, partial [Stylosanthes scabra]|nr:hypothetical protein [Stylosanthes scabra]